MSHLRRSALSRHLLAAPLALALTGALVGPATADDYDTTVVNLISKKFEVLSNGVSYTGVKGLANLVADVRIQIGTGTVGGVQSWSLWLGIDPSDAPNNDLEFPSYKVSKSYPWYNRPDSVNRVERIVVPKAAWSDFVVAQCNAMAEELRQGGMGDQGIFMTDRKLELAVVSHANVDTAGSGSGNIYNEADTWSQYKTVDVICQKAPAPNVPQASGDFGVQQAQVVNKGLSIQELATLNGACKIRLDFWVTTDLKNAEVKYRYRDNDGKKSQVWTVNTGENRTATVSHWYDIPNGPGLDSGQVRAVGVSHEFQSAWTDYELDCKEGGPSDIVANDPPKLTMKFVEQGKIMVQGQICPKNLKLVGVLEGRGNYNGQSAFVGANYPWFSAPRDYSITHGQKLLTGATFEIPWHKGWLAENELLHYELRLNFNATNDNGVVVSSLIHQLHVANCKRPKIKPGIQAGQGFTVEPKQPTHNAGAKVKAPATLILQNNTGGKKQKRRLKLKLKSQ